RQEPELRHRNHGRARGDAGRARARTRARARRSPSPLRRQIARRYLRSGVRISPEEIVITSGALEALNLSLQVLTRPGDIVAVESPAFYACLQAIEALRLRAIEIPSQPRDGVDVGALAHTLERHPVRACWLMSNYQNPLGALVPEDKKRDIARLLDKHDIALIEDDVYAELFF